MMGFDEIYIFLRKPQKKTQISRDHNISTFNHESRFADLLSILICLVSRVSHKKTTRTKGQDLGTHS